MTRLIVASISFIVISSVLSGQSFAKIDPKSIVGMWTFNEGKGDKAKDLSGNGYDGELMNGPEWVDGKFGNALSFDGVDDFVEIPLISTSPIMTFSCWFKRLGGGHGGVPRLHTKGSGPWSLEFGIGNNVIPNQLGFYLSFNDGSLVDWIGVFEPQNEVWYHTAISWDGKFVHVYVNGNVVYSGGLMVEKKLNSGISRIGGHVAHGDCFKGLIDEVAIYNVALSQEDIKDTMTPKAISQSGKLATTWGELKSH